VRWAQLRDGIVHHANGAIGHGFAGKDAGSHVGQLFPDQSEIGNYFPKGLSLPGISDRALNAGAS
jgi:hypothetical protein